MTLTFTPVHTEAQIETVADLAHLIWHQHYVPLIGRTQVDYMVAKFQSAVAIRAQLDEGYEYFLVRHEAVSVGYIAVQARGDSLFVSKFYLRDSARGRGTGRVMMAFVEGCARERGLTRLWLTVNKAILPCRHMNDWACASSNLSSWTSAADSSWTITGWRRCWSDDMEVGCGRQVPIRFLPPRLKVSAWASR